MLRTTLRVGVDRAEIRGAERGLAASSAFWAHGGVKWVGELGGGIDDDAAVLIALAEGGGLCTRGAVPYVLVGAAWHELPGVAVAGRRANPTAVREPKTCLKWPWLAR